MRAEITFKFSPKPLQIIMSRQRSIYGDTLLIDMNAVNDQDAAILSIDPQTDIDYKQCTVAELRQTLRQYNLPTTGRKQDLVRAAFWQMNP